MLGLYSRQQSGPTMSRISQLEQALQTDRFTSVAVSAGDTCSRPQLLKRLLLLQRTALSDQDSLEVSLAAQKPLQISQADANLLYFCDQLFLLCQLKAEIDPELLSRFMLLRPVVATILLEEGIAKLAEHPLMALLNKLWYAALYWTPALGKPGEKYKIRLIDLLQRLRTTNPARAPYAEWLDEFNSDLDKEFHRAELLANRISQAEKDRWIRSQSRQIVQHNVNRTLQYADMPKVVEDLLKGPWADSLHQTLISHGIESHEWHNLLRLAEYILDSVQIPVTEKERNQLFKLVPRIPGMLRKQLLSVSSDDMDHWISGIEQLHMRLLTTGNIELRTPEPLPLQVGQKVNTSISSALINQVACIPEGQWLVYRTEEDEPLLCRLSIKLEDAGQLLFVNVFGAKTLQKSFAEFAYLLTARHIHLLNTDTNFTQCVRDMIDQFLLMHRFHQLLQVDAEEWRRKEQARMQREAKRRKEAQLKAQQEAKHLARQRHVESEQSARAKKEAAKRQRMKDMEEKLSRTREQTTQEVDTLTVGAWLDINLNGTRTRCKLAAIVNNQKTYIFTNRDGAKQAEWSREQICDALLNNNAIIIDSGQRFGNSLETIIKNLRQP